MTKRKRPEKEVLEKLIAKGMTQAQIAEQFGVTRSSVEGWYRKYGLHGKRTITNYARVPKELWPKYRDRAWLEDQYIEKGRTTYQIARELGVHPTTIQKTLRAFGIPLRHQTEMPAPYKDEAWLRHQYINLGKTFDQIGRELGVKAQTIWQWAQKFSIQSRDWNEEQANHVILSNEGLEFISGELLGDMSITMNGKASAKIEYGSKYPAYLRWLSMTLSSFGIEQQSKISSHTTPFGSIGFRYCSKSYRELTALRKKWYPDGKKSVPRDLKLTPIVMRQWYIGDGALHTGKGKTSWIFFATDCFDRDELCFLADQLSSFNLPITLPASRNIIRIGARGVKRFLDLIGPCPKEIEPWYGYKWAIGISKAKWIENVRPRLLEQSSNKI